MLSTYLTYRMNAQDLPRTLSRVAAQTDVKNDADYYQANIGKVKTVDDFLSNTRLFNYAMKAYGLQDMSFATAFMKQVLTSDLTDPASFANKLNDTRYHDFASAFNFSAGAAKDNVVDIQTDAQSKDTLGLYTAHITRADSAAATQTSAYQSQIATVTTVDQFLANDTLRSYALKAVGLDPNTSDATLKQVLTGDLSAIPASTDPNVTQSWHELAAAFSFNADGSVSGSGGPQSSSQLTTLTGLFTMQSDGGDTPAAAKAATDYYNANISKVNSVSDFLADRHLVSYLLTAYGVDPSNVSDATLSAVLTSNPNDPNSFANASGFSPFKSIAMSFNFQSDGSLASGATAQTTTQQNGITQLYQSSYNSDQQAFDKTATAYFSAHVTQAKTVTDLAKDPRMYQFLLTAYDIDPSTMSPDKLAQALKGDWTDPASTLNAPANAPLKSLVRDFNFDTSGNVSAERRIQTAGKTLEAITKYTSASVADKSSAANVKTETDYYQNTVKNVSTLPDLFKNQRLVDFLVKAYGVPKNLSDSASLQKILTSDLTDPNSFVNQQGNDSLKELAAAFNFNTSGGVTAEATDKAQATKDVPLTEALYVRESLEENVGQDSEGARLALYFQRKAAQIKSPYDILADKALLQVVQTAVGLPADSGHADITVQADMISSKINLADFKDPALLDKFLVRFSALYDLQSTPQAVSDVASLFGGAASGSSGGGLIGLGGGGSAAAPIQYGLSDSLMGSIQSLGGN